MSIPANCTVLVIECGPHRSKMGWMRGTWEDRIRAAENWNLPPGSQKVFVHGIAEKSVTIRFAHVREATALEIGLWEMEHANK